MCFSLHLYSYVLIFFFFFFFNDTATTEIYTLSLHDALPIPRPGSPTCSPASPRSRRPGCTSCCPGIGRRRILRPQPQRRPPNQASSLAASKDTPAHSPRYSPDAYDTSGPHAEDHLNLWLRR